MTAGRSEESSLDAAAQLLRYGQARVSLVTDGVRHGPEKRNVDNAKVHAAQARHGVGLPLASLAYHGSVGGGHAHLVSYFACDACLLMFPLVASFRSDTALMFPDACGLRPGICLGESPCGGSIISAWVRYDLIGKLGLLLLRSLRAVLVHRLLS